MRMVYFSGSHDAVAISPMLHGTGPEIFSRNNLRIADKTVRWDDSIVESNHQECLRVFHFRIEPALGQCVPSAVVQSNMYPQMDPRT
jgi:hypothetical protein